MSILLYAQPHIALKPLCRVFEHSGIAYDVCTDQEHFLNLCKKPQYTVALVIHTEGIESLLQLHGKWKNTQSEAAFIVLSQRQSGAERVRALQAGVKGYHITPFSYTQLVMDVAQYEYQQKAASHIIEAHGLAVDTVSRSVTFQGKFVTLTKKQFELLLLLMRYPGKVYSRVQIWEHVWSGGEYPLANTVDVHVNRLRKKLPSAAARLIETVYGFGYRLKPR